MNFAAAFARGDRFLLEGALGERLKREYGLMPVPPCGLGRPFDDRAWAGSLENSVAGVWPHCPQIWPPLPGHHAHAPGQPKPSGPGGAGAALIQDSVAFLRQVLAECTGPTWLGGMVGCHGDAYTGTGRYRKRKQSHFTAGRLTCWPQPAQIFCLEPCCPPCPEAGGIGPGHGRDGASLYFEFYHPEKRLPDRWNFHCFGDCADRRKPHSPLRSAIWQTVSIRRLSVRPCLSLGMIRAW